MILGVTIVIGALLQTFFPRFLSGEAESKIEALTLASIGILISYGFLVFFLRALSSYESVILFLRTRGREGFENLSYETQWKTIIESNKIEEICKLYTDMYAKILQVEKGPPEDQRTDAQAREKADERFRSRMKGNLLPCHTIEEVQKAKTLDSFYTASQALPKTLLIQAYETAIACRSLLIDQYNQVKTAQKAKVEGFQEKPICSPEVAAFKQKKKMEEQECVLVEEISPESKRAFIEKRLTEIETEWKNQTKQESIQKILDDCAYYKAELDIKTKEAEELSNKYSW